MKRIVFFLSLLLSISTYSQEFNYSISASYNQTFISDIRKQQLFPIASYSMGNVIYSNVTIKEKYTSRSGFNVQANISYKLLPKVFIESGLQINVHRYNKITEIDHINNDLSNIVIIDNDTTGFPTEDFSEYEIENENRIGDTRTIYLEIPIKIGYSFLESKLKCKLGIISSFLAYADVYQFNYEYTLNQIKIDVKKDKSADGFNNLMFSGNIELDYLLYKGLGINISYAYSFNSIYNSETSIGKPKYNLLSAGISYRF